MANITDPNAITFSNNHVRTACDQLIQLYWHCKAAQAEWTAKGINGLFPNDASPVVDGASADGRTAITGADVNAIVTQLAAFITDMEASSNAKRNQVSKVSVNWRG